MQQKKKIFDFTQELLDLFPITYLIPIYGYNMMKCSFQKCFAVGNHRGKSKHIENTKKKPKKKSESGKLKGASCALLWKHLTALLC